MDDRKVLTFIINKVKMSHTVLDNHEDKEVEPSITYNLRISELQAAMQLFSC